MSERCPTCGSEDRMVLLNPCVRMQEYLWLDGLGDGCDQWHERAEKDKSK